MATVFFGILLGFAFGLTGSGGSTLAVPLLVYGVGLAPHKAVCVSMITIGALAALQSIKSLRSRQIVIRAAATLAAAGALAAPLGAWAGRFISGKTLLSLFAVVVVAVALRLLFHRGRSQPAQVGPATTPPRAGTAFLLTGFSTGFLAGLLGIGGGFVLTPALVLFCRLDIHQAIKTSVFSIALISVAAMTSHWLAGQRPPMNFVLLFTLGGILGLAPGCWLSASFSGPRLLRVFAVFLLVLAGFILARNFLP